MSSTQIGLLRDVFTRTEHILAKLTSQDLDLPTPCTDFDVRRLRDHLIGWTLVFAAYLTDDRAQITDSPMYRSGPDPVLDYRHATAAIIDGLSSRGESPVVKNGTPIQPSVVTVEILAEHLIHYWDLATAAGQSVAFISEHVQAAEIGLASMLSQPYAPEGFQPPTPFNSNENRLSHLLARSGRDIHLTDTRKTQRAAGP